MLEEIFTFSFIFYEDAKLKYPISLFSSGELSHLSSDELRNIETWYWTLTPYAYRKETLMGRVVASQSLVFSKGKVSLDSYYSYARNNRSTPVRPSISLNNKNKIISGSGSEEDPWIIE